MVAAGHQMVGIGRALAVVDDKGHNSHAPEKMRDVVQMNEGLGLILETVLILAFLLILALGGVAAV